jgi:hypothetical protein
MSVQISLDETIYPLECITEARVVYSELCSVALQQGTEHSVVAEITSLSTADEKTVVNEFLNYLLNLCLEKHLRAID